MTVLVFLISWLIELFCFIFISFGSFVCLLFTFLVELLLLIEFFRIFLLLSFFNIEFKLLFFKKGNLLFFEFKDVDKLIVELLLNILLFKAFDNLIGLIGLTSSKLKFLLSPELKIINLL